MMFSTTTVIINVITELKFLSPFHFLGSPTLIGIKIYLLDAELLHIRKYYDDDNDNDYYAK